MKKIFSYLLQGLLYSAPLFITAYIIYQLFKFVDGLLQNSLQAILGISIPGLGVLLLAALLVTIGYFGQTILAQPIKLLYKNMLKKAPVLKVILSAFEDLFAAFVGKERKFNRPVIVLVNSISNLEKLGFLTEEDLTALDEKDKVAVYFPHSYNFSGELFIVPREHVRPVAINPSDAMKFIVSGGVAGWNQNEEQAGNSPEAPPIT